MFTIDDFITGDKFKSLADFVFLPNLEIPTKDCIIFCKTDFLNECIPKIEKANNKFILISHNSDGNIVSDNPRAFDYKFTHFPKNVKIWYVQNVNVYHPLLIPIPIGLENLQWFPELRKKENMLIGMKNIEKSKLLYVNHNIFTNVKERTKPYEIFKNTDWSTVIYDSYNGKNFNAYVNDLRIHKFVICPFGNGIDIHKSFETLYLGAIPIVKKNEGFIKFKLLFNIPFVFVNDWEEVTKEFLENIKIENNFIEEYGKFENWRKLICQM